MRPEGNPLDLNNFPEDYTITITRDGSSKQHAFEDSCSSAATVAGSYRKKKSGAKEGKDEAGKVYECRFCSLKFCKSQALGGHMNRHRQERETETLNKARQLVFTNDLVPVPVPVPPPHHHLGYLPGNGGGYHHHNHNHNQVESSPLTFRSLYPTRMYSTLQAPAGGSVFPNLYGTGSGVGAGSGNDYFVGHVIPNSGEGNNYTCIGAPVGHGVSQEEVLNWGRR